MTCTQYIGMGRAQGKHFDSSMNAAGKIVMECVIETKAGVLLQFFNGLRGDVRVTFEEADR